MKPSEAVNIYWVELCGVRFHGFAAAGDITFQSIKDWYGVADVKGSNETVPAERGSFSRVFLPREAKVISLTGTVSADSREAAESLRLRLQNELAGSGIMRVSDATGVWQRYVEVQQLNFQDTNFWNRGFSITVDCFAPDPAAYSEILQTSEVRLPVREGGFRLPASTPWNFGSLDLETATATIENWGTLPLLPVITVTGSANQIVIDVDGRKVGFGEFAGELVFDSRHRRCYLNGQDVTRRLTVRDWPEVPPGRTGRLSFEAVLPSPDLKIIANYQIGVW